MKLWEVPWGDLIPGDIVQAPNGSLWKIGSAITHEGRGEWELISPDGKTVWSEHAESEMVPAWRDKFASGPSGDPEEMLGLLRMAFGSGVEMLSKEAAKVGPNAPRWIKCGQKVCVCRW